MSSYVEYRMDDGSSVLVETEEGSSDIVKASRGGINVIETGRNFTEALASVRGSLQALVTELDALRVEEAEVKFGLKAVGEAGVIAVAKVSGEMNYEVTLRWKKAAEKPKTKAGK